VWIDCAKGADVAPGEVSVSQAESDAQVEADLVAVATEQRDIAPVSAEAEFERAAKICAQAKRAVISMFEEARMGKAVDTGGAKNWSKKLPIQSPAILVR